MSNSKLLKTVSTLLTDACEASRSVLACCKQAAFEAKGQLDKSIECPQKRANQVVALYREIYGKDANVKSNFSDALYLQALGDMPISFEDVKGNEVHTTAEKAATDLSKHNMKKAVKEARDELGTGRRAGGGRKPAKPIDKKPVTSAPATPSQIVQESKVQQKAYWETFARGFHSDEWVDELKDVLKAQGYRLTKIPTKK